MSTDFDFGFTLVDEADLDVTPADVLDIVPLTVPKPTSALETEPSLVEVPSAFES